MHQLLALPPYLLRLGKLHPSASFQSRLNRMPEQYPRNSILFLENFRFGCILKMVHHAHGIPMGLSVRSVLKRIEAPHDDRFAAQNVENLSINMPI